MLNKKIVVLIPAHNEEESIGSTIESLLNQTVVPTKIVVLANGCTDKTVQVAKQYNIIVEDMPKLEHRKSEALNYGWKKYCKDADIVVCVDADTELSPIAVEDWVDEFHDKSLGGSSSKFTMKDNKGILTRLQKAEYAAWIDSSLKKKKTTVLSGTGCALNNKALKMVAERADREGPWSYASQVEDFELTYRIQELGYKTQVSPTIRAYTDSMRTIKALWRQRMKWQVGTIEDLIYIGFNKKTRVMWMQQIFNLIGMMLTALWLMIVVLIISLGLFVIRPIWFILPGLVVALDLKNARRIPHVDKKDILLAFAWFPHEAFVIFRQIITVMAWKEVLWSKITRKKKDRWAIQYRSKV